MTLSKVASYCRPGLMSWTNRTVKEISEEQNVSKSCLLIRNNPYALYEYSFDSLILSRTLASVPGFGM